MVGNIAGFTNLDLLRCLFKIEKPMSRSALSESLELGEGTIRSILDILKGNNLLVSGKKGHYLSQKGKEILKEANKNISISKADLSFVFSRKKGIAVQIKHVKNKKGLGKAYELRDTAVKAGADGALILKYDGRLKLYELEDTNNVRGFKEIENEFSLEKNDLVVAAYADSYKLAEYGALAVAIEVSSNLKSIMQKLK
ncbi:hypothetical protein HYU50_01800 [Candidatus Woesearchaeota archaeon]|nr:hypothetical protein [Candidatus Woesearchaeota archaeon]